MLLFLPKMTRKMEAYAVGEPLRKALRSAEGLQSKGAAPDKNTYRMNKSVQAFEKAVKDGDKPAALAAGSLRPM